MWSLLGARGVDALSFESFGEGWVADCEKQLRIADLRVLRAAYGDLPPISRPSTRHATSCSPGTAPRPGVRIPDGDWISGRRDGLVLCDATSAAFAMELPWDKLDVVTWSWQKVLGGEAQHGMLALGAACRRAPVGHRPPWPLPKLFRLTSGGKLIEGLFRGETINTPSMLAVEDALDGLRWAERIGGLPALIERSRANLAAIEAWVEPTPWVAFLARVPRQRSSTSICLAIADPAVASRPSAEQAAFIKAHDRAARGGGRGLRHRGLSRCAARPAYLGRRHRRDERYRAACCRGSTGRICRPHRPSPDLSAEHERCPRCWSPTS